MEIYSPENIFTRLIFNSLPGEIKKFVSFKPASLLSKSLNENKSSIGLIPTTEIITNKEFFISKSFGLSFEGQISNSYIYYLPEKKIDTVKIAGDVSSMDVILAKILFKELYDTNCEVNLQSTISEQVSETTIIVGDNNFINSRFENGISVAEEFVEMLSAPFVSFVAASTDQKLIEEFTTQLIDASNEIDISSIEKLEFPLESRKFIAENMDKVFFGFDEQDIIGIRELLQMLYYHGLVNDIADINFV